MDQKETKIFSEPTQFSQFIQLTALKNNQTCLQTLVEFLEQMEIDPRKIKNLVAPSLKDKLKQNYIELGLIKGQPTLQGLFE